jgi:transposase-like protein
MVVRGPLAAQSFLLSAAARTLSLKAIYAEGEASAYRRFCRLRWPDTDGAPICPVCGCVDSYDLATRRRFKCAACHRQFSATSGTIFASHKLSFVDLLAAVCLVVNASKGLSAVQLSRDLNVQHKTAFVLMHKLREAMSAETVDVTLSGEVEVDGAAFGGHVRPANMREERLDRRLLANRSGKRRVVVALRQRGGRILTRTFIPPKGGSCPARSSRPTKARTGICWSHRSRCDASRMQMPSAATAPTQTTLRATSHAYGA